MTLTLVLSLLLGTASAPHIELRTEGIIQVVGLPDDELARLRRVSWSNEEWQALFRVSVDGTGKDLPAVLGNYAVVDRALQFRPAFPLDPGRRYRAVLNRRVLGLRDGEAVVEVVVSLPAPNLSPRTIVEQVYPSAGVVPENLLKLYVHFSRPMGRSDGLPFVHLLDAFGTEIQEAFLPLGAEFWNYDGTRYTVFFDPGRVKRGLLPNEQMGRALVAGQRYALVIDREWLDADGLPLKSSYRKDFIAGPADMSALDVAAWQLQPPAAGTRDPLVIDFPESLDRGLLERTLGVTTERDEVVPGEAHVAREERGWRFVPQEPWRPGAFKLVALSILEDLAGNKIGKPFEVDIFERVDRPEERESYVIPFSVRP